jgi:hypothetical protein
MGLELLVYAVIHDILASTTSRTNYCAITQLDLLKPTAGVILSDCCASGGRNRLTGAYIQLDWTI